MNPPRTAPGPAPLRTQGSLIFFVFILFFCNMMSRLGFGPLLPAIKADMGLSHAQGASLFLFISVGYGMGLFGSIFLSSRLSHRRIIVISSAAVGMSLLLAAAGRGLGELRGVCCLVGIAGGLYLPSGVAVLTHRVRKQDWGKVLSLHQLAPNMAYICAPWAAAAVTGRLPWRWALAGYGIAALLAGGLFHLAIPPDDFRGAAPRPALIRRIAATPAIWILILLFGLALGVNQGLFSILPLYLIAERHLDPVLANHLLAVSRLIAFAMPLASGWAADRFGLRAALYTTVAASSCATFYLSAASGPWLGIGLICQAVAAVCFFPLGFAVLSRITTPDTRSIAVAVTIPVSYLIGAGIVPTLIGWAGDAGRFGAGIGILGGLTLFGMVLLRFVRMPDAGSDAAE